MVSCTALNSQLAAAAEAHRQKAKNKRNQRVKLADKRKEEELIELRRQNAEQKQQLAAAEAAAVAATAAAPAAPEQNSHQMSTGLEEHREAALSPDQQHKEVMTMLQNVLAAVQAKHTAQEAPPSMLEHSSAQRPLHCCSS